MFTYSCDTLIRDSSNVGIAVYGSLWSLLPMDKYGKMLRRDMMLVILRSKTPCCLTASGFFIVSLETYTRVSKFNYCKHFQLTFPIWYNNTKIWAVLGFDLRTSTVSNCLRFDHSLLSKQSHSYSWFILNIIQLLQSAAWLQITHVNSAFANSINILLKNKKYSLKFHRIVQYI